MRTQDFKCENCGHFLNIEHPFYSEDFARAFLFREKLGVLWCLHCNHISEYRQFKLFGLFPTSQLRFNRSFPFEELNEQAYWKSTMDERGGLFGYHILRLIWHSIDSRAKLLKGDGATELDTLKEALARISPLHVALSILAVSNTEQSLGLEDQIHQGIYVKGGGRSFRNSVEDALRNNPTIPNSSIVLEILEHAAKPN